MIVLGGLNMKVAADASESFVEQVGVLNLETLNWTNLDIHGDCLMRRAEHSTGLVSNEKIYIFGGYDKDFTLYNSI